MSRSCALRLLPCLVLLSLGGGACAVEVDAPRESDSIASVEQEVTTAAMSREEIIALASSGVGFSYWWGHGRWDPSSHAYPGKCSGSCGACSHWASPKGGPEHGADCSGYLAKVWQVPSPSSPKIDGHPYSTKNFRYEKTHWYPIKKSELKAGDALTYHNGSKGHIALFDHWSAGGKVTAFECSGCKIGCIHKPRSFASYYIAIRRRGIEDEAKNDPPKGYLDSASCDKGIKGWAQDSDVPKQALDVVLSFDGPLGKSSKKLTVQAAESRSDLCKKLGSCNHGFSAAVPDTLKDGKKHSVYAYGVDSTGKGQKLLIGAPRSIQCQSASQAKTDEVPKSCAHPECQTGSWLHKDCSPCASAVCLTQPACCDSAGAGWTAACVDLAGDSLGACRGVCAVGTSSCAHSECEAGDKLAASCSACAGHVCKRDGLCCSGSWDWICAKEAKEDPWCICPD